MSRILLIGEAPPSLMGAARIEAANYRTAQFLEPLLSDGHEILLVTPAKAEEAASMGVGWEVKEKLTHINMDFTRWDWVSGLSQATHRFEPDCILAIEFSCCVYASRLFGYAPIWMDFYGDPLTIMQAATYRMGSNRGLITFSNFVRSTLQAGDVFSVCSTPQLHMLTGELAMSGRLNKDTFAYEFGRVIMPGSRVDHSNGKLEVAEKRELLAAVGIPESAFIVLWAGGYNTWTDVDTLFIGLSSAMDLDSRIEYVSVGASAYHASDQVYERFQRQIARSSHRDRFHLLGWRPWTEMESYYRESDVGINIDSQHYETTYGTRTRLVEMIGMGLPAVTSYGTELSRLLVGSGSALGFDPGDATQLSEHLISLASNPSLVERLAHHAIEHTRTHLAWEITTQSVREWVRSPSYAPDHRDKTIQERVREVEFEMRSRIRWALWLLRGAYR